MKVHLWSALVAMLRKGMRPCLAAGIRPALNDRRVSLGIADCNCIVELENFLEQDFARDSILLS